MKQEKCTKESFKIIGLSIRSNTEKYESSHERSRMFPIVRDFVHQKVAERIPHRVEAGTLICGYTNYESDSKGYFTYFIGEKVDSSVVKAPEGLTLIEVPKQKYLKFTNGPGSMPSVIKEPWTKINSMSSEDLGGERSYKVDWEVYDERAKDHSAIVLDLYIGIKGP